MQLMEVVDFRSTATDTETTRELKSIVCILRRRLGLLFQMHSEYGDAEA